ncbi:MAG: CHAT domain-containing protein [Deltaproteobacteria bacterium]|nr:CHAT domain-containing protein [Deltaproteobacteria bacterium]
MRLSALGLVWIGLGLACSPEPKAPPAGGLLAGCATVIGDRCEGVRGRELQVYLPVPRSAVPRATLAGRLQKIRSEARARGTLVRLKVPEEGGPLVVWADTGTRAVGLSAVLQVETSTVPPTPERRAAMARYELARRQLRSGDNRGAVATLAEVERDASDLDPFLALRANMLAAQLLADRIRDPAAALALIGRARSPGPLEADGQIELAYHQGRVAEAAGQGRMGAAAYDRGAALAEAVDSKLAPLFDQNRALAMINLGQASEGAEILARLVESATTSPACWRADFNSNAAWAAVRAGHQDRRTEAWMEAALALYQGECENVAYTNNVRVNLALWLESRGDRQGAARRLAEVSGEEYPDAALWRRSLAMRLALAAGPRPGARAELAAIISEAELRGVAAIAWQAQVTLGELELAASEPHRAATAFQAAEDSLEREVLLQPLERGRLSFVEDRAKSADGLIAARLAQGDPAAAFLAARAARRRGLVDVWGRPDPTRLSATDRARFAGALGAYEQAKVAVDQALADGWQAPRNDAGRARAELESRVVARRAAADRALLMLGMEPRRGFRAPNPGELWLLHRAGRPGQAGALFVATTDRVRHVPLPSTTPEDLVRVIGPELKQAQRILILAAGDPALLAWHRAELDGRPLLADRLVAYALDLPPRPISERSGKGALVVADPRGNLARARIEGPNVARSLSQSGWQVELLERRGAVSDRVLAALPGVQLFHYAGHAAYRGREGAASALVLADRDLELGELLLLSPGPRWVVLSACESSKGPAAAHSVGLGLAQAMVSVGAEAVIASTEVVEDETAAEFSARLYSELPAARTLEEAYRRAMVAGGRLSAAPLLLLVP